MENYRCAIIGQHPMRFPWGFDEEDAKCRRMKLELAQCIMELRQCGVTEFQVACDPGVGLYAGEIVNITKQNDEAMRLVCVTPFEEQATKWTPQLRERYFDMLAEGCTPQEARSVLPNSLKTEVVMTANIREWRHFLKLRCSPAAHPQMREVALILLDKVHWLIPVCFDDIWSEYHADV